MSTQQGSSFFNDMKRRIAALERTLAHIGKGNANVKSSFDQMMSHTTQEVADDMAREYATIDRAIKEIDQNLPNKAQIVDALNSLRNHIPMRFNIPDNVRIPLSDIIAKIFEAPSSLLELGAEKTHTTPTK